MPSEWREIFDAAFCAKLRDQVWDLLPDRLVCEASFDPDASKLTVRISERVRLGYAAWKTPLLPARKVRGFEFIMPPIESWEAREWMDQADKMLGSVVSSIEENLPGILADFEE